MPATDAPDWQTIVTLTTGSSVTDAPDWTDVVTGPGGTPPVVAAGASPYSVYYAMGMLGVTCDIAPAGAGRGPSTGRMNFQAFTAGASGTVNNVYMYVVTGTTPTANENFFCIYDWGVTTANTYTLLGQTAAGAIDTALHSTQLVKGTLTAGVPIVSGTTYVLGFLMNGTVPSFASIATVDFHVLSPFFPNFPQCTFSTAGFTAPPASLAYSAVTGNTASYWGLVGP
jgi:hypothetical protein